MNALKFCVTFLHGGILWLTVFLHTYFYVFQDLPRVELANSGAKVRRDVVAELCPLGDAHPVIDAVDVLHKVLPRPGGKGDRERGGV